jgi:hypothetical protein
VLIGQLFEVVKWFICLGVKAEGMPFDIPSVVLSMQYFIT